MPKKLVLRNCDYDKVAMLHEITKLIWKLDQYEKDARKDTHPLCAEVVKEMRHDLEKHAHKLKLAIVGLSKEGKF